MMKRYLPVALAVLMVAALALPAAAGPFADVPEKHWAYEAVKQLAAYGLVEGFPDGTYKGAEPMTRYQMAMVVARLLVSLDAQIKAEIEAAKAGAPKVEAPVVQPVPEKVVEPGKVIEKETVTVEKPIIEKVVETTIVEKLKTEELDALAARVEVAEGKIGGLETRADETFTKVAELGGGLALLEGDLRVRFLELESKIAAGDADSAEALAAFKAEVEARLGDSESELSKKVEVTAKEIIGIVDALKAEFAAELDVLNVRVSSLEGELALVDAKLWELDTRLAAVEEGTAVIGAKLDSHLDTHEKVKITGSSEVVLKDVDIFADFTENYAWVDPGDIYGDDPHSEDDEDDYYVPTSKFQHELKLTLTAYPADGVVVKTTLATVKDLFAGEDSMNFEVSGLSLEAVTPGVLVRIFAGGVELPEGTFTPYTLTAGELLDDDDDPLYQGVVAQVGYGRFSGTTLFLRVNDAIPAATTGVTPAILPPSDYAQYICAGEGRVAVTDNLNLGVAYVSLYDDPQSVWIDDGTAFYPVPYKDTVISVAGDFRLSEGWNLAAEFAKNTKYANAAEIQSGTATDLSLTGVLGKLDLEGYYLRVEESFEPSLINYDTDEGGIETDVKTVGISAELPLGNLTLTGGFEVTGDADAAGDWDDRKATIANAGAKYEMAWGAMTVTPSVGLENTLYVLGDDVYPDNSSVLELTGGVEAKLAPFTGKYEGTYATYKPEGGVAERYYTKNEVDLDADYAMTPNLKLTGGYTWTKLDKSMGVSGDEEDIEDTLTSVFEAGAAGEFPLVEGVTATASYNYALKTDHLDEYKPYTKSILKAGVEAQLTPKAKVDGKAEFQKLDKWENATEQYAFAPMANLIAEVNYSYDIATNTALKLGYKVVKSDTSQAPIGDDGSYLARIISGSLKVTF